MQAIAEQQNPLEGCQAIHKRLADTCLRERGMFPDKKGYESTTLLLRALSAMRNRDHAAAETHVKEWKACAQEQIDEQLFGESAGITFDAVNAASTIGTDESTRNSGCLPKNSIS
eukprot:660145-Prymnesium_polylepis.1